MAERIVSMHAAHRSGKEVIDGLLSRPTAAGERQGHRFAANSVVRTAKWLRKVLA